MGRHFSTAREAMERLYAENPTIGRKRLMKLTGASNGAAQRFLEGKKKEKRAVPEQPKPTAAAPAHPLTAKLEAAGISETELDVILKSMKQPDVKLTRTAHVWGKGSFKFACISDTHIGHVKAHLEWWLKACDLIHREKCDVVFHPGDITEGMSGRPGHIYELEAVGVNAQVDLAVERLGLLAGVPIKAITGNHDQWAFKAVGIDIGATLQQRLDDFEYLGPDEADVTIDGVTIKLWHGGDGASYATSYRTQKFVEGLTGGEKPHILLSGHAHKSIMHECRNVMVFEAGTLCGQTGWMRGKKLAAHVGFWIIEVFPAADAGIERLVAQWVPFFRE